MWWDVRCDVMRCEMWWDVRCDVMWCDARCDVMWCAAVRCDVRCDVMWWDVVVLKLRNSGISQLNCLWLYCISMHKLAFSTLWLPNSYGIFHLRVFNRAPKICFNLRPSSPGKVRWISNRTWKWCKEGGNSSDTTGCEHGIWRGVVSYVLHWVGFANIRMKDQRTNQWS